MVKSRKIHLVDEMVELPKVASLATMGAKSLSRPADCKS